MTTRDPDKRKKRPEAERSKPNRKSGLKSQAPPPRGAGAIAGSIDEAVAEAVQSSYDVFNEAVEKTRSNFERFRQGDLPMNDLQEAAAPISLKAIDLARQLSKTTLDLCEEMVTQMGTAPEWPQPGKEKVPPFVKTMPPEAESRPNDSASGKVDHRPYKINFEGDGRANALAHSGRMNKSKAAKKPEDLEPPILEPHDFEAKPLECKPFETDLEGKLSVAVMIQKDQEAGFYIGTIKAKKEGISLGVMCVEVRESA